MVIKTQLTEKAIIDFLDEHLEVEFTFLTSEQPAAVIAKLARPDQDFILDWVRRVCSLNIQLAYQFITYIVDATTHMDKNIIEAWLSHAMDVYDQKGLYAAREVITNVENFIQNSHERSAGAVFDEHVGVLTHFAHGLSGRKLTLEEAEIAGTDSETIFLPAIIGKLPEARDNFVIYKAMVTYHWAQARYGTFRVRLSEILKNQAQPEAFLNLFHALDTLRLNACIQRELPGLFRDMQRIDKKLGNTKPDAQWLKLSDELSHPEKSIDDVLVLTQQYLEKITAPPPCFYQGVFDVAKIEACMALRIEKEKSHLKSILRKITEEIKENEELKQKDPSEYQYEVDKNKRAADNEWEQLEVTLDGQPMPLPEQARALTTSILQDLGEIPEEYLTPAGPGEYDPSFFRRRTKIRMMSGKALIMKKARFCITNGILNASLTEKTGAQSARWTSNPNTMTLLPTP